MKVTIQAVEERRDNVEKMLHDLGDSVDVEVYYDTRRISPLDSFVRMLDIPFSGYRLHLQDDVIIPKRFVEYFPVIESDMSEMDCKVLSVFAPNRKDIHEAADRGEKYIVFKNFLWLQATVFSDDAVKDMKQYYSEKTAAGEEVGEGKHDDCFVQEYMKSYGEKAYVHIPSLVQHNVFMGSVMSHSNSKHRMSKIYDPNFISQYLENNKEG